MESVEDNYRVMEKETLKVAFLLKRFLPLLDFCKGIHINTDHKGLWPANSFTATTLFNTMKEYGVM